MARRAFPPLTFTGDLQPDTRHAVTSLSRAAITTVYRVTIETVDDLFKLGENSVNYKDFGLDNFLLTA